MGARIHETLVGMSAGTGGVTVEIPANTSDDWLLLCVSGLGLTATFTTPSGWTLIGAGEIQNASGITSSIFIRQGGISGSVSVGANIGCPEMFAFCSVIKDAKDSSIEDFSVNNANTGGILHFANTSPQSTSETDVLLIGFFGVKTQGYLTGLTQSGMSEASAATGSLLMCGLYSLLQGTAGATAQFFVSSAGATDSANFLIGILKTRRPSVPMIIQPDGGNIISKGTPYSIQWQPSTSPLIAQSSIKYEIYHSSNNGAAYTLLTTTAAGATSYTWTTSGLTPGNQHRIKIRAKDETNSLFSEYDTSAAPFTVIADAAPLAPTNLRAEQPDGTVVTIADKDAAIVVKGTFVDPGDVLTKFDMDWGTDGATYPNTTTTTSGTFAKTFAGGTFSAGRIYFRVRTYDYDDTPGAYGYFNFMAGPKPTAPTISAPTNASPPVVPNPTVIIAASTHTALRWKLEQGGTEVVAPTVVNTTGVSFPLTYALVSGQSYELFVARQNSYGIWSDYASETFTPSYTQPATPTLNATADDENGCAVLAVENSDMPNHNLIYASDVGVGASDWKLITPLEGIEVDGTFRDHHARSGVERFYAAVAVSAAGLLSDPCFDSTTVNLKTSHIHTVTKTSSTANAINAAKFLVSGAPRKRVQPAAAVMHLAGRREPFFALGEATFEDLGVQALWIHSGEDTRAKLEAIQSADDIACYRDRWGNLWFGYLFGVPATDREGASDYQVQFRKSRYDENVAIAEVTI